MSAAFKVGEVAIMCNRRYSREYNGMECTVLSELHIRSCSEDPIPKPRYVVLAADGMKFAPQPYQLRRKLPPSSAKAIMRAAILKAKQPQEVEAC